MLNTMINKASFSKKKARMRNFRSIWLEEAQGGKWAIWYTLIYTKKIREIDLTLPHKHFALVRALSLCDPAITFIRFTFTLDMEIAFSLLCPYFTINFEKKSLLLEKKNGNDLVLLAMKVNIVHVR